MIKRIIVFTHGDRNHEATIETAIAYAATVGAEVTGLFVKPDYLYFANIYGEFPLELSKTFYERQQTYSNDNKAVFEAALEKYSIKGEWHDVEQYDAGPRPSFYSDCIFVSQANVQSGTTFSESDFIDSLIMSTGIPVIVIPNTWHQERFATRPVLGWKECKEATSAVRHAMPFLQQADEVDIVTISDAETTDEELIQGIQISEYLSLHDVNCRFFEEKMVKTDVNEADTLLRHCKANNGNLIVVGGYSHPRFKEIILGGVTRRLLRKSPIPVLFAH